MKKCFKCNEIKPLSYFYKHPMMADGHLGKCKQCTCADTEARRLVKSKDLNWVESELARHREKSRKCRELGLAAKSKPESVTKWALKNKEKRRCHHIVNNAVRDGKLSRQSCEVCGSEKSEAHHEDYSRPLYVKWLCKKHHMERHVEIRRKERMLEFITNELI